MSDLPGTFVQLLSEVFDAFWLCKKFIINENQNQIYVVKNYVNDFSVIRW